MIFTPGLAVGAMSGSTGGITASRNRYGTYFRVRAIPITSQTTPAINARAAFTNNSQTWRGLTDAQRLAWGTYANGNPVINALGQAQILSGNAIYLGLNARLYAAGLAVLTDPPVAVAPVPLLTLTQTFDIGAGTFDSAFTTSPVPASTQYQVWAAVVSSPGINYVKNLMKFVGSIAAAAASPFDAQSIIEARFGALQVGHKVFIEIRSFSELTGLVSDPLQVSGTVVTT